MQKAPNLDYIKTLAGDDLAFEQKFIGILKEEFPKELDGYTNYIAKQELKNAAEMVHKLKHKFNILSMTEAYEFAVVYEEALVEDDARGDSNFLEFLNQIKNYLNTL